MSLDVKRFFKNVGTKTLISGKSRGYRNTQTLIGDGDVAVNETFKARQFGKAMVSVDAHLMQVDLAVWTNIATLLFGHVSRTTGGEWKKALTLNGYGKRWGMNIKTIRNKIKEAGFSGRMLHVMTIWICKFLADAAQIIDVQGPENSGKTGKLVDDVHTWETLKREALIKYHVSAYELKCLKAGKNLNKDIFVDKKRFDADTIAARMEEAWRVSMLRVEEEYSDFVSNGEQYLNMVKYIISNPTSIPPSYGTRDKAAEVLEYSNFIPVQQADLVGAPSSPPDVVKVNQFLLELRALASESYLRVVIINSVDFEKRFSIVTRSFDSEQTAVKVVDINTEGAHELIGGRLTSHSDNVVGWRADAEFSSAITSHIQQVLKPLDDLKDIWALAVYQDSLRTQDSIDRVDVTNRTTFNKYARAFVFASSNSLRFIDGQWVYGIDRVSFSKYSTKDLGYDETFPTTKDLHTALSVLMADGPGEPTYGMPNPFSSFDAETLIVSDGSEYKVLKTGFVSPCLLVDTYNLEGSLKGYTLRLPSVFPQAKTYTNAILTNLALEARVSSLRSYFDSIPPATLVDVRDVLRDVAKKLATASRSAFKTVVCSNILNLSKEQIDNDGHNYRRIINEGCLRVLYSTTSFINEDLGHLIRDVVDASWEENSQYDEILGV